MDITTGPTDFIMEPSLRIGKRFFISMWTNYMACKCERMNNMLVLSSEFRMIPRINHWNIITPIPSARSVLWRWELWNTNVFWRTRLLICAFFTVSLDIPELTRCVYGILSIKRTRPILKYCIALLTDVKVRS